MQWTMQSVSVNNSAKSEHRENQRPSRQQRHRTCQTDFNWQNAGRPTDKIESRLVKPHQPPEDGHLGEVGIKEDLEEREKGGVSIQELRPHIPYLSKIGDRPRSPLQSTNKPQQPTEMGDWRRRRREPVKPTKKLFYLFYMFYYILYYFIYCNISDVSSWVQSI